MSPRPLLLAALIVAGCHQRSTEDQLNRSADKQSRADAVAPQPPETEAVDDDAASPTPADANAWNSAARR